MMRDDILYKAKELIGGDRAREYGDADENFTRVGKMWEQVLGVPVDSSQVALCMVLLKVSRAAQSPSSSDSWVDIAGYAALGGEVSEGRPAPAALEVGYPDPIPATTGHIDIVLPPEPIESDADVVDDPVAKTAKKQR